MKLKLWGKFVRIMVQATTQAGCKNRYGRAYGLSRTCSIVFARWRSCCWSINFGNRALATHKRRESVNRMMVTVVVDKNDTVGWSR